MIAACPDIADIMSVKQPPRAAVRGVRQDRVAAGSTCGRARRAARCSCGDSSPNRHESSHARTTKHPVIASAEPGERWLYCYVDEVLAEY